MKALQLMTGPVKPTGILKVRPEDPLVILGAGNMASRTGLSEKRERERERERESGRVREREKGVQASF